MADPTDLIREADAALAREAANEGGPIVDDAADLVRRLRDALEASEQERERCHRGAAVMSDWADGDLYDRIDELRAENATLRATIEARGDALMRAGKDNLRLGRDHDTLVYALEQILHVELHDMDEVETVSRIIAAGIKGFRDAYPGPRLRVRPSHDRPCKEERAAALNALGAEPADPPTEGFIRRDEET